MLMKVDNFQKIHPI